MLYSCEACVARVECALDRPPGVDVTVRRAIMVDVGSVYPASLEQAVSARPRSVRCKLECCDKATGACIAAVLVTVGGEYLRFIEEPINFWFIHIPAIPGMRMVIFSIILILMMIFARHGIMGTREFNWRWVIEKIKPVKIFLRKKP